MDEHVEAFKEQMAEHLKKIETAGSQWVNSRSAKRQAGFDMISVKELPWPNGVKNDAAFGGRDRNNFERNYMSATSKEDWRGAADLIQKEYERISSIKLRQTPTATSVAAPVVASVASAASAAVAGGVAAAAAANPVAGGASQPASSLQDLNAMKPSALRKIAANTASEDELEDADDNDDAKAAYIALIQGAQAASGAPPDQTARRDALEGMKPSALRKIALQMAATDSEMEEAEDSNDPKTALVELILKKEREAGGGAAAAAPADGGAAAPADGGAAAAPVVVATPSPSTPGLSSGSANDAMTGAGLAYIPSSVAPEHISGPLGGCMVPNISYIQNSSMTGVSGDLDLNANGFLLGALQYEGTFGPGDKVPGKGTIFGLPGYFVGMRRIIPHAQGWMQHKKNLRYVIIYEIKNVEDGPRWNALHQPPYKADSRTQQVMNNAGTVNTTIHPRPTMYIETFMVPGMGGFGGVHLKDARLTHHGSWGGSLSCARLSREDISGLKIDVTTDKGKRMTEFKIRPKQGAPRGQLTDTKNDYSTCTSKEFAMEYHWPRGDGDGTTGQQSWLNAFTAMGLSAGESQTVEPGTSFFSEGGPEEGGLLGNWSKSWGERRSTEESGGASGLGRSSSGSESSRESGSSDAAGPVAGDNEVVAALRHAGMLDYAIKLFGDGYTELLGVAEQDADLLRRVLADVNGPDGTAGISDDNMRILREAVCGPHGLGFEDKLIHIIYENNLQTYIRNFNRLGLTDVAKVADTRTADLALDAGGVVPMGQAQKLQNDAKAAADAGAGGAGGAAAAADAGVDAGAGGAGGAAAAAVPAQKKYKCKRRSWISLGVETNSGLIDGAGAIVVHDANGVVDADATWRQKKASIALLKKDTEIAALDEQKTADGRDRVMFEVRPGVLGWVSKLDQHGRAQLEEVPVAGGDGDAAGGAAALPVVPPPPPAATAAEALLIRNELWALWVLVGGDALPDLEGIRRRFKALMQEADTAVGQNDAWTEAQAELAVTYSKYIWWSGGIADDQEVRLLRKQQVYWLIAIVLNRKFPHLGPEKFGPAADDAFYIQLRGMSESPQGQWFPPHAQQLGQWPPANNLTGEPATVCFQGVQPGGDELSIQAAVKAMGPAQIGPVADWQPGPGLQGMPKLTNDDAQTLTPLVRRAVATAQAAEAAALPIAPVLPPPPQPSPADLCATRRGELENIIADPNLAEQPTIRLINFAKGDGPHQMDEGLLRDNAMGPKGLDMLMKMILAKEFGEQVATDEMVNGDHNGVVRGDPPGALPVQPNGVQWQAGGGRKRKSKRRKSKRKSKRKSTRRKSTRRKSKRKKSRSRRR